MTAFQPSAILSAHARVQAAIDAGQDVVPMALGEARLPVHPALLERFAAAGEANSYAPVIGSRGVRESAAMWFGRRGIPSDPDSIITGPGSKPLIYAAILAIPGDLVVPVPTWGSYSAQASLAGKRVTAVPAPPESGGIPDPVALRERVAAARRAGQRPGIVMATIPDNPTSSVPPPALVSELVRVAREEDLVILCDEVYRDLAYDQAGLASPGAIAPDLTVVTAGLSKTHALGGWRFGFARVPSTERGRRWAADIAAIASEIWSGPPTPVQNVAEWALTEPPELVQHVEACRRLHRCVIGKIHEMVTAVGASCVRPQAIYYVYPDFGPGDAVMFAAELLERHSIAVLPGPTFGDVPSRRRFRASASLLYGADNTERWAALRASDPLTLPWIAHALDRVSTALEAVRVQSS